MQFLNEKQLRNLTTERLNNVRKTVITSLAAAKYRADTYGDKGDIDLANHYEEYYSEIKEILATREHLETKKKKTPKNQRETIRRFQYE